jgi:hypothetical protein
MTRTIPALAAFDMPANPPLEAKVLVSPKAVFSVISDKTGSQRNVRVSYERRRKSP